MTALTDVYLATGSTCALGSGKKVNAPRARISIRTDVWVDVWASVHIGVGADMTILRGAILKVQALRPAVIEFFGTGNDFSDSKEK